MKRSLLAVALLMSINAYATPPSSDGTTCNGNGSCGSTTNNTSNTYNQPTATGYGGNGGSAIATGGAGGHGGAGGNATGGSVLGSGNSSVKTDVKNTNVNTNANIQGQIQGQGQKQGQSQATENSNNSSLTVQGDNFESARNAVSTAYAPSIAPTANCALSVSGGVSVMGFSGSFGKAYIDENCAKLEMVRSVAQVLGDKATSEALMCQDKAYAKARATAGRNCPVEQE